MSEENDDIEEDEIMDSFDYIERNRKEEYIPDDDTTSEDITNEPEKDQ